MRSAPAGEIGWEAGDNGRYATACGVNSTVTFVAVTDGIGEIGWRIPRRSVAVDTGSSARPAGLADNATAIRVIAESSRPRPGERQSSKAEARLTVVGSSDTAKGHC